MKSRLFSLCLLVLIAVLMLFITGCPLVPNKLPSITKVSGPSGIIYQISSTFSWSGSDPDGTIAKYEYRKDEGSWVGNGTSTSYTWSCHSEGEHTFEVRAQDDDGDYSEPVEWDFKYSAVMVSVEGGNFTMGDTCGDGSNNEKPTHLVLVTYDFEIGKYETTFDEYDAFCEATGIVKPDDEGWGRGTRPVINVSWNDAIAYCNWLSEKEKLPKAYDSNGNLLDGDGMTTTDPSKVVGYRLPTEAEWEYAARGGNKSKEYKYSGSDNVDEVAWYWQTSGDKTREVGKKTSNELRIHDMSGNVWEWCSDWYGEYSGSIQADPYNNSGSFRVARGGCWWNGSGGVRVAVRGYETPTAAGRNVGFRICRTAP